MKRLLSIGKNTCRAVDRDYAAILLLVFFSAALFLPAAFLGIPENYDLGQHLRFARTWHDALGNGEFLPSWGAADNAGLGSAGVRFYPPVTHFLMGIVQFATGSWYDTIWITMLMWMAISSVGAFKLAREWSSRWTAFASGLLYVIVPYHLLQVFQSFLLAEFAAAAILPVCFLYAHRLVKNGGAINVLLFSASYSALILTHIPTTIIGTLSLAVFITGFLSSENIRRNMFDFAYGLAISLAATSFFWVRMISELSWIKHNTPEFYASGAYNYSIYFFPMLYTSGEVYWTRYLWLFDLSIVVTCALMVPSVIVLIRRKLDAPRHLISWVLVAGLSLFMMSVLSLSIWDNIAFVQKLQFPYRWLSVASLAAALLFPIGITALAGLRSDLTRAIAYLAATTLMAVVVLDVSQIIVPSAPVPREEIARTIEDLDHNPGCDCWWPVWATRDSIKHSEPIVAGDREFSISKWAATHRAFTVEPGVAERVRVGTFFYPHWMATVNGMPTEVSKGSSGLIEIPIPPETATISLEFREPLAVTGARYASVLAIAAALFAFLFYRPSRSRNP